MRSLRDISARRDSIVELADWVEISTFFRADRTVSEEDLVRALVREGGTRFEDTAREKAADAFEELSQRAEAIGTTKRTPLAVYPFAVDGPVLSLSEDPFGRKKSGLLYCFLLTVTRASMDSVSRKLNRIDPTALFEDVCAESLCEFWGGRSPVSDVYVTGTSNKVLPDDQSKRFPSIINTIATHVREGVGWKVNAKSPGAGDGGLDLAVWRRFNDKRPGGLVGFAQCKTGDSWREHLGKNNPESICHAFFTTPFVLSPLPIYMVPCRVGMDEWTGVMRQHRGILFDRCRITTFGTTLKGDVANHCTSWLRAAIERERTYIDSQLRIAQQTASGAMQ